MIKLRKAPAYLRRELPNNRLRVKEMSLPLATSEILGVGIDTTTLPEGHLACGNCARYKFEAWLMLDNYRIELGCLTCGQGFRLVFPVDMILPAEKGRWTCFKHPKAGIIVIHCSGNLCLGCERCKNQVIFDVKPKGTNLIMPGEIN